MAQYQSFPDAAGDSHTLDKLKALKLPDVEGRSFLDVGCNEGFFCGFARFQGASRVVGVDHSRGFITRARQRFPDCEFICTGWNKLPDESFDVILLASALHYADDQPALISALMDKLTSDGVLVLEVGIASSEKAEWTKIRRGIDERYFPSMPMLREVLADYAWKWMGRSVRQDGDPIGRHVIHISRRRPVAYLLMQPPGYGKSSIASRLFVPAGVPVVSGDQQLSMVAEGKMDAGERITKLIKADYSPFHIDEMIRRIFERELGEELVDLWAGQAGGGDFALDGYVPSEQHAFIEQSLAARGYLPVRLHWDRIGSRLMPADTQGERAEAFYLSLVDTNATSVDDAHGESLGFVDELSMEEGQLVVRGWAVDSQGALPTQLGIRIRRKTTVVKTFDKQSRPDVQRHLGLPHALVGYRFAVDAGGLRELADIGADFEVFIPSTSVSFSLAGPLAQMLATVR